jgi:hypothetical protein
MPWIPYGIQTPTVQSHGRSNKQAHEAGADDTVPEWVQETLQEDGTTPGLGPEVNQPLRGGFVVDFDNLSHDTFGLGRQGTQQGSISGPQAATQHQQETAPPPSSFIVPTFHSAPGVDNDITMGESIVTDRVAAVETSIANMEGTCHHWRQVSRPSSSNYSRTNNNLPLVMLPSFPKARLQGYSLNEGVDCALTTVEVEVWE